MRLEAKEASQSYDRYTKDSPHSIWSWEQYLDLVNTLPFRRQGFAGAVSIFDSIYCRSNLICCNLGQLGQKKVLANGGATENFSA